MTKPSKTRAVPKVLKDPRRMTLAQQVEYIKRRLGHVTYDPPVRQWLKTGSRLLSGVLGSFRKGIAYGKCITLAGDFSSGKTLLAAYIAGLAQQDGAVVAWVDLENSFDGEWVKIHGLDPGEEIRPGIWSNIALFQPEIGIFAAKKKRKKEDKGEREIGKRKSETEELATQDVKLQTAEELFTEVEDWMVLQRRINPGCKIVVVIDSTTAILPEEEMEAAYVDQNMRSRLSLSVFLNTLTKRMNTYARNCNAIVVYVSQIRIDPGVMFGNPEKIPGGKGILFYPSVICVLRRSKNGAILQNGRQVGLKSIITNIKNKAGGGSIERLKCGMKSKFREFDWKFLEASELKEQL